MIRTYKVLTITILSIVGVCAQPTNLKVTDTSPQQAIVQYTAPDTNPCTLAVADQSGMGVTVWDVNNLFPGATSDLTRSDTQVWDNGRQRRIILGHRSSENASDGKLYSRSLQANTSHSLTVTCGTPVTIPFKTKNIPVGNMAPDPPDFNTSGFGNAAWPTIDWSDRQKVYVDHKTGVALRALTQPGDMIMVTAGQLFNGQYDAAASWTSADNIKSGSGSSLASSGTTDPLFVAINTLPPLGFEGPGYNWQPLAIAGFRLTIIGNGDNSTAGNRQISFCLTVDSGQSCASGVQNLTLNRNSNTTVCFPACATPLTAPFGFWGFTTFPQHNLLVPFSATVNTNGTTVTSTTSVSESALAGGLFPTNLAANSRVLIGGTQYAVSSVDSALQMTLGSDAGMQTGVALKANNFGIKLWKTNATGTVQLTATYDLLYTSVPTFLIENGASDQCSPVESSYARDKNGNSVTPYKGRLCLVGFNQMGSMIYLLRSDTGESWPVAVPFNKFGGGLGNQTQPNLGYAPWDPVDAQTLYGRGFDGDSAPLLVRWIYRGDGRSYTPGALPDSGSWATVPNGHFATGTTCISNEQTVGNLCSSILTLTPPGTQVSMLSADAAHGAFGGNFTVIGLRGKYIVTKFTLQQDGIALFAYVNRTTGIVEQVADTMWSRVGGRFGGMHTAAGVFAADQYHMVTLNPLGSRGNSGPFAGPYLSPVSAVCRAANSSGVCTNWDTSNTAISNNFTLTCPASVCGSSVTNALLIRIAGEPCSQSANDTEKKFYACPWDANQGMLSALQVGDVIGDKAQCNAACSELLKVMVITVNSTTNHELWVQRGANGNIQGASTFANGWSVMPFPSYSCDSAEWWFDITNGSTPVLPDSCSIISHIDVGPGPTPGHYTITGASNGKYDQTPDAAGFSAPAKQFGGFGAWQGLAGDNVNWLGNGRIEFYQSLRQISAPSAELTWAADWRAYQGGDATGGGSGTTNQGVSVSNITAFDLSTVYKISNNLTWPYKVLPGEGWAGRFILKDISPNNVTTSTPYTYCVALTAGECAPSASAGDVVFYIPGAIPSPNCFTNQMEAAIPCVVPASPIGNWAVQEDISKGGDNGYGGFTRRLTMAFNAPSRQYTFTNWRPTPDAKWGMLLTTFADGIFPVLMLAKVPEWPGYDSVRRDALQTKSIKLGPGAALAEIRFGYQENGSPEEFYCTKRAEGCVTKTSPGNENPYNFLQKDGHSGVACTSGCSISIPSIPGRIVWWQEFRSKDGGVTWNPAGRIEPLMLN